MINSINLSILEDCRYKIVTFGIQVNIYRLSLRRFSNAVRCRRCVSVNASERIRIESVLGIRGQPCVSGLLKVLRVYNLYNRGVVARRPLEFEVMRISCIASVAPLVECLLFVYFTFKITTCL